MCDRDESWANLNTYQTCLNYRGKMRYKNYSSQEKKNLKQFIPYIIENALQATIHKAGSSRGSIAEMQLVLFFFYQNEKGRIFRTLGQMICAGSPACK